MVSKQVPALMSMYEDTNSIPGAVSGPKGTLVFIQDALKKAWPTIPDPPAAVEVDVELKEAASAKIPV